MKCSINAKYGVLLSHKLLTMTRLFIFFVFCFFASLSIHAQTPINVTLEGHPVYSDNIDFRMCNEAGTFTFGTHIGQSNDVDPDTIYLCLGDTLPIIHNGDFDLSGDPVPATPGGVGYAFYDCIPTVAGPDLANITTDPCLNTTSPIIVQGLPIPQAQGIWVAAESINGDLTLFNNGVLQAAFNGGFPEPIQFWFAPITIDNFDPNNPGYENGGPCVDVNTDDEAVFSVVYLNEVTATNIDNNTQASGCGGSFTVSGGLPEFDNNTEYDIKYNAEHRLRSYD